MKRIILIQSLALLGNAQSLPGLQSFPDAMLGFGRDIFGFLVKGIPYGPAPTGCSEYEIIVGRGTGEFGPFGFVVGDPIVTTVSKAVPGTRGYAVQYPARLSFSASAPVGVDDVVNRLNKQHKNCPNQKFALMGYSQGAGVMHGVFGPTNASYPGSPKERPTLNQEVVPKILSLVMFGDSGFSTTSELAVFGPQFPPLLFNRLRQNCADGDMICDPRGGDLMFHLSYDRGKWLKDSTDFIIASFKGETLPPAPRLPKDVGYDKPVPGRKPMTEKDFRNLVKQIGDVFKLDMSL